MNSDKGKEQESDQEQDPTGLEQKLEITFFGEYKESATESSGVDSKLNEVVLQEGQAILNGSITYNSELFCIINSHSVETSQAVVELLTCTHQAIQENNKQGYLFLSLFKQRVQPEAIHDAFDWQVNKLGNADAMYIQACMHKYGCMTFNQDYQQAIDLLDRAIELNHKQAMCSRAFMYYNGTGCLKNKPEAAKLFLQSGTEKALAQLARYDDIAEVVSHNPNLVLQLLKKSTKPINHSIFTIIVSHKESLRDYILQQNEYTSRELLREIVDYPNDSQLAKVFHTPRGPLPTRPGAGVLGEMIEKYHQMEPSRKIDASRHVVFFSPGSVILPEPVNRTFCCSSWSTSFV